MGIRLFVGGHACTIQGERVDLAGDRMFSAAHGLHYLTDAQADKLTGIIDSGAFSDPPERRLTPEPALDRQLAWEAKAREKSNSDWRAYALVSYDLLIDETWANGERKKQRWNIRQADWAVSETIEAARYLASQRKRLSPRRLILSTQGVDSIQYKACAEEVLKLATPDDIFGFGGWCILGRFKTWIPEFWRTIYATFPLIRQAGIKDVHIFGVLYLPVLGPMLWLADQYGLRVSTDSSSPLISAGCTTEESRKRGGQRMPYWKDNINWWIQTLATLRQSEFYKQPPALEMVRQLDLFQEA